LAQILDNLLSEGKAVPMIVVVPEAHALPPEDIPVTDHTLYLSKNQQAVGEELFHDIIPFIETHYNIRDDSRGRAIAGLSMGGLQATETGIVHSGYFGWIGAFSPGVRPAALSEEFKNALEDREKINKNLLLFEIVVGDDDRTVGDDVTKFEARLKEANVQHVLTLLPGGTHSMFVWRPALSNNLPETLVRFTSFRSGRSAVSGEKSAETGQPAFRKRYGALRLLKGVLNIDLLSQNESLNFRLSPRRAISGRSRHANIPR
jgi:enterochelin esterase-like enzyme